MWPSKRWHVMPYGATCNANFTFPCEPTESFSADEKRFLTFETRAKTVVQDRIQDRYVGYAR